MRKYKDMSKAEQNALDIITDTINCDFYEGIKDEIRGDEYDRDEKAEEIAEYVEGRLCYYSDAVDFFGGDISEYLDSLDILNDYADYTSRRDLQRDANEYLMFFYWENIGDILEGYEDDAKTELEDEEEEGGEE